MSFKINLASALNNVNRHFGQPRFPGNANVPIREEINEQRLIDRFRTYQNSHGIGAQVHELVAILAAGPWHITAAVHQGGFGGAAGGADPRYHITLSTGHHIRFGSPGIIEITGAGITPIGGRAAAVAARAANTAATAAAAGGASPPPGANALAWIKNTFSLTDYQAAWVFRQHRDTNAAYPTLAARARTLHPNR